jgi:hypothetical protein
MPASSTSCQRQEPRLRRGSLPVRIKDTEACTSNKAKRNISGTQSKLHLKLHRSLEVFANLDTGCPEGCPRCFEPSRSLYVYIYIYLSLSPSLPLPPKHMSVAM